MDVKHIELVTQFSFTRLDVNLDVTTLFSEIE